MTQHSARADLSTATSELWAAVCELVLIALEDAPSPSDLAVVDDLVDTVSGLQGDVAACRDLPGTRCPGPVGDDDGGIAASAGRGRTPLLARDPGGRAWAAQLRSAVRRRGGEWGARLGSVQESAARCEAPLWAVESACHPSWTELNWLSHRAPAWPPPPIRPQLGGRP